MAEPLTSAAFHESARAFAQTALEAHLAHDYRRVAVDAGTALEHLVKASLVARSPALIVDLRSESSFQSLLSLLGMSSQPLQQVRTVSSRDALQRIKSFITSPASERDLRTLVDVRDGTVHAAMSDELEESLLVAFAQHVNALLSDQGKDRSEFWGSQLGVVDALLSDASDKVKRHVDVLLAGARARFEKRYGSESPEVMELLREVEPDREIYVGTTMLVSCPVCQTPAALIGTEDFRPSEPSPSPGRRVFHIDIEGLSCRVCGLRLRSKAEMIAAGLWASMDITPADPDSQRV